MVIDSVKSDKRTAYLHGDSLLLCLRVLACFPISLLLRVDISLAGSVTSLLAGHTGHVPIAPSHPARVNSFSGAASLVGRASLCLRSTLLHAIFIWHRSHSSFSCHLLCSQTPPFAHHWTVPSLPIRQMSRTPWAFFLSVYSSSTSSWMGGQSRDCNLGYTVEFRRRFWKEWLLSPTCRDSSSAVCNGCIGLNGCRRWASGFSRLSHG